MRLALAISLAGVGSAVSIASADHVEYANPNVTEIRTDASTGERAIIGVAGRSPFLTVEKVSRGRVVEQREIERLQLDAKWVVVDTLTDISLTGWKHGTLSFRVESSARHYACAYRLGASATCTASQQASQPVDEPTKQLTIAELETLTEACTQAFRYDGATEKDRCIASATAIFKSKHKAKTVQIVQKCKEAFKYDGTAIQQKCLAHIAVGSRDPLEIVDYCLKHNKYEPSDKKLQCMVDLAK